MSKTTFVVSDPHFSHNGVCVFTKDDGSKLRPWDDPLVMNEALVENWNSVVRQQDRVYVLGDITMPRRPEALEIVSRLNGDKVLIHGNHDLQDTHEYLKHFRSVRGIHVWDKCALTHVPIHPQSVERWRFNVHGHLHSNQIMIDGHIDPRYLCCSMEQPHMDFRPVEWSELMKIAEERKLKYAI